MDLFKEIDDLSDLFLLDKNGKLDSALEGYEDLQSKYSSLHENYAKELENSKKVEKCLLKCLKFYSKLCKKYEVQQNIISNLEESIKKKVNSLEEAQRNEEKLKGLIQVYRSERALYAGQTTMQLRKEKEILLDICCKLVSESVRSNNVTNLINQLLRKFKKDLDDDKIFLLKSKMAKLKDEFGSLEHLKTDIKTLKDEIDFNSEDKYSSILTKEEIKNSEEDTINSPLDLSLNKICPEKRCLDTESLHNKSFDETEPDESEVVASLPPLKESHTVMELFCSENNKQQQGEVAIKGVEECSLGGEEKNKFTNLNSIEIENCCETVGNVVEPGCYGKKEKLSENYVAVQNQSDPQEFQTQEMHCSRSIFDISDVCLNSNETNVQKEKEEISVVLFENNNRVEDLCFINNPNTKNVDLTNSGEEFTFPYENELVKIFKEMSSVRMISPIRESNNSVINNRTCAVMPNVNKNHEDVNLDPPLKRNSHSELNSFRNKKFKSEEEKPNCYLLDSIMSAMSIQNEEFKSQSFTKKDSIENMTERDSPEFATLDIRTYSRKKNEDDGPEEKSTSICHISRRNKEWQQTIEKLVTDEIKNFVSSPILCKEDADKNVRHCISVLSNKPEDLIAKCIVAIILENIEETVEIFERPAPPLTKTQHRLIILLSVIRTLDWDSEKISAKILSIISEKLFPDNFFWPDDSVEEATRFYAALCRAKNDSKTLWKFCLNAMTGMRQRCPLLVFTVLKTWPDILYDASTLKNNILAVTIVNIFLHMPKTEGLRNLNQRRKLGALKHLLMNFYQFKVEDTIENYTKKVLEAVCRGQLGSEKSIVLLSRCRDQSWTMKNVVPTLKLKLVDWMEGKIEDSVASIFLSVIRQICPIFMQENSTMAKFKEIAVCLSEILVSGKKTHDSEVNLIEVLLQLKQYPDVRKVIREWIPKSPISEGLRNEIINVSAENILRELKLNRKKKSENFSTKKKQWKKVKGKKKKVKRWKKNEQKSKGSVSGLSSKN